jgi:hypothetical protein
LADELALLLESDTKSNEHTTNMEDEYIDKESATQIDM